MQDIEETGNVTAPNEEVMEVESSEPKTLEDIRRERLERLSPSSVQETEEEVEEVEEESTEEAEETDEIESEETEEVEEEVEEEGSEDVLSQIDWDALDDETRADIATQAIETLPTDQLAKLAKLMGSGSGKRIGELTGQIKDLKNQVAAKDKALEDGLQQFVSPQAAFANVTSQEELDETSDKIRQNIKFYQKWLGGDEDYFAHEGQEFSRSDVLKYVESLQDQYDDIPKQRDYLRSLEKSRKEAQELQKKAESEFDWLNDDESKASKLYDEMISSSDIAIVERVAPSLASKLKYQLRHAANSMAGVSSVPKGKKIALPRRVPSTAKDSAAGSASPKVRQDIRTKKLREAASKGDLKAARELRTMQIQNRNSLFKRTT
jgi:hypothetical protein